MEEGSSAENSPSKPQVQGTSEKIEREGTSENAGGTSEKGEGTSAETTPSNTPTKTPVKTPTKVEN